CAHFLYHYREHRDLHSFPTRRSSDLRIADETIAAKRTLIGSDVKVSKVAQVLAAVRNGILADRFIRFIFAVCTNFTNLTTWCYRSEEHTSELQSRENLVCRLLLEKKK